MTLWLKFYPKQWLWVPGAVADAGAAVGVGWGRPRRFGATPFNSQHSLNPFIEWYKISHVGGCVFIIQMHYREDCISDKLALAQLAWQQKSANLIWSPNICWSQLPTCTASHYDMLMLLYGLISKCQRCGFYSKAKFSSRWYFVPNQASL